MQYQVICSVSVRYIRVLSVFHYLGMVGIGGFFIMGGGYLPTTLPELLGAASVLLAFVNVSGGFVITKRMLDMFKRECSSGISSFSWVLTASGPTDPPEYPWLYAIPGLLFGGGFIAAASTGMAGLVQAGYLVSSILCMSELYPAVSLYMPNLLNRFHIWPCLSADCSTGKSTWHIGSWLGNSCIACCCRPLS